LVSTGLFKFLFGGFKLLKTFTSILGRGFKQIGQPKPQKKGGNSIIIGLELAWEKGGNKGREIGVIRELFGVLYPFIGELRKLEGTNIGDFWRRGV